MQRGRQGVFKRFLLPPLDSKTKIKKLRKDNMNYLIKNGRKIICTQLVIIALVVLAQASVEPLANKINEVANQFSTDYYQPKLTK